MSIVPYFPADGKSFRQSYIIKDSEQSRNRNPIVGHRNSLRPAGFHPAQDIFAIEHAGTAMDDKIDPRQILGKIPASCHGDMDAIPQPLAQKTRELDPSDILTKWPMGARLRNQDMRLRRQFADRLRRLGEVADIALMTGKQHRK